MGKHFNLQLVTVVLLFSSIVSSFYNQEMININRMPVRLRDECELRVNYDLEYNTCRKNAFDVWYVYHIRDRIKHICCLQWNLIECQRKSVYKLCDRNDFKDFMARKDDWIYQNERQQCFDYPYGSYKCSFSSEIPDWTIGVITFVSFMIVVALGIVLICYCVEKLCKR
jgi:hypothetical protein